MTSSKQAGVDRSHNTSLIPKLGFTLGHLLIVLSCTWLIYFDGWTIIGNMFGQSWELVDHIRASILLFCAALYWFRHFITLFYLLYRKVAWSEVLGLLVFFALFEIGLVIVGGGAFHDNAIELGWLDILALFLLVLGSFLNSYSEIQRKWWKANPANKGHCYTKGLFSHSMHINFFGDTVLFTGWCLFTYSIWTLALPIAITLMFIFFHIPSLDNYLISRYGEEFKTYAEKTKKLIPFVY